LAASIRTFDYVQLGRFAAAFLLASLSLSAQVAPTAGARADDAPLTLSEFEVRTTKDKGYRASNSVTGSRFDTAIKDLAAAPGPFFRPHRAPTQR